MDISSKRYYSSNAESNLTDTFKILRQKASMFDVTLGCVDVGSGEVKCFPAHKVLLAAYSPVFTAICEESIQQSITQPFIHLVGISQLDLFFLLNFMYNGEVDLPVAEVESFLAAAQRLQVTGISDQQDQTGYSEDEGVDFKGTEPIFITSKKEYSNLQSVVEDASNVFAEPKVETLMSEQEQVYSEYSEMDLQSSPGCSRGLLGGARPFPNNDDNCVFKLDEEIDLGYVEEHHSSNDLGFEDPFDADTEGNTYKEENIKEEMHSAPQRKGSSQLVTKTQEGWQCKTCMYTAKHKHTVKEHAMRKHTAPEYIACHYCQKICRDRVKFRHHVRNCSKQIQTQQDA